MNKKRNLKRVFVGAACLLTALAMSCEHSKYWRGSEPWPHEYQEKVSTKEGEKAELARRMAPAAPKAMPDGYENADQYILKTAGGCISCHGMTDEPDMHAGRTLALSCVDCHGGNGLVRSTLDKPGRPGVPDKPIEDVHYLAAMAAAHVAPRNPEAWYGKDDLIDGRTFGRHPPHRDPTELHGSAYSTDTYMLLNQESPEFIRFVNPGDLRVAAFACGSCHAEHVANVNHSMMAHGAMLWGAALYNNGSVPNKTPRYGESYSPFGLPQRLFGVVGVKDDSPTVRPPYESEQKSGVLYSLEPLPPWNIAQPGNILRVFERGTKLPSPGGRTPNESPSEIGLPNPLAEGGRPDKGLSPRGLGTLNRTDPVFLGLQKTRLLDPILSFPGTNDHPGDYRAAGCTACHVPYANDRSTAHSGTFAAFGNSGHSSTKDPTIPRAESGHPVRHVLTNSIPSSQCVVCHMHPGTSYANSYFGYMWWDNESDGEHMYPSTSKSPSPEAEWTALRKNPEGAQLKGLWGNLYPGATTAAGEPVGADFLEHTGDPEFNQKLEHNQFADFHGHGWMFRAVFKKDRRGNLLDDDGKIIDPHDPEKWKRAVHLQDVHLQKYNMHCVDCHFAGDVHGNGKLYGEARTAVEITCIDCHGTFDRKTNLRTSGPAAPPGGTDLSKLRTGPQQEKRFFERDGKIFQRSAMDSEVVWELTQTVDTINPVSDWAKKNPESAKASRYAKTIQRDNATWGDVPKNCEGLAHRPDNMQCYTCHSSWMTSCAGCHLSMRANQRTPMLHNEGLITRNFTQYNFQVLRDDTFMLGRDQSSKGGLIVPVRSSSAVVVSSQNANREWIYHQQQTVSGEGYSGQSFNPHFPHATSARGTTKTCSDCHVSSQNDNNAWMAQLLLQGTNFVNFFGRYVYVAEGRNGLQAVPVTEHDEPQAVYGSHLHQLAYPDEHKKFVVGGSDLRLGGLDDAMFYHGAERGGEVLDLQHRGEYLYAACGSGGFHVYDIANIDNKGFSERITSAPVSPIGQELGFKTKYAVAIASPSTVAVDPARARYSSDPLKPRVNITEPAEAWNINQEQAVHPLYAYLYIADREEGLILTFAGTLLDGDPRNNFMERAKLADGTTAFNPNHLLDGMTGLTLGGHYVYATAKAGLVVIDIDKPLAPKVVTVMRDGLKLPRAVAVQFRYAFVTDSQGLKVIDITDPLKPTLVSGAFVPLDDAHRIYVARTYAFVAAGKQGLAIIDVTSPPHPAEPVFFTADGKLNDARDVKVGMTNASLFAYVADGQNGLKVLELMGPHTTPQFRGFAPPLAPRLIANYQTDGPALAVSKGLDRDRAVDETGHQVAVFGRIGARPFNLAEMQALYLREGKLFTVTDVPQSDPKSFTAVAPPEPAGGTPPQTPLPRRPGPPRPK